PTGLDFFRSSALLRRAETQPEQKFVHGDHAIKRPTRPTGLGMLEISEAGSAWPSTAAPDRGLGRSVARRGRAPIRGCKAQPSLIWIKAIGIEDGNCETVTTRMQPSVIVWDLETVPDLGGFAAANDLVGKPDVEVREAIGDKFPKHIYHQVA